MFMCVYTYKYTLTHKYIHTYIYNPNFTRPFSTFTLFWLRAQRKNVSESSPDNRLARRLGIQPESRLRGKFLLSARVKIWRGWCCPGQWIITTYSFVKETQKKPSLFMQGAGGWVGGAGNPRTGVEKRKRLQHRATRSGSSACSWISRAAKTPGATAGDRAPPPPTHMPT